MGDALQSDTQLDFSDSYIPFYTTLMLRFPAIEGPQKCKLLNTFSVALSSVQIRYRSSQPMSNV